MTFEQMVLVIVAACFAVVTGANDGSSVLSAGLTMVSPRALAATAILVGLVVTVPIFLGTNVATTFTERLVELPADNAGRLMTIAVLSAVIVVAGLTRLGLPTSLTLALIGGIVGVGLGAGVSVGWSMVTTVLLVGLAAPLVGGVLAYAISAAFRLLPPTRAAMAVLEHCHRFTFVLQCLAYSLNDAQKMLAVLTIAFGVGLGGPFQIDPQIVLVMGAGFTLGTVIGLPSVGLRLSRGLYAVRTTHAVAAELASGVAVLASAGLGVPVSMTQAVTGGLVGAGVDSGAARVRWKVAIRLVAAWLLTLPVGALLGLVGAVTLGALVR